MNSFFLLDLHEYCNHKLIYGREPKSIKDKADVGLDNIYILKSLLKINEKEAFNGIEFNFTLGQYDNIVCEGQSIPVETRGEKLHIIGFAYWGDINEYFRVVYEDGEADFLKIPFIDWSHPVRKNFYDVALYGKNIETVKKVPSSGAEMHFIHFHHSVSKLQGNKKIKEIILPDNMFIHIFAMTIEKN